MSIDEFKWVAERLQRIAKGEPIGDVYNDLGQYDHFENPAKMIHLDMEKDREFLINIHLAEHPGDDDEPVTGEWLDSLFGVEEYICTEQDGNFDEVITWIETIGNVLIPMPKTRGDFRRLCKVLKIDLKEKHETSD